VKIADLHTARPRACRIASLVAFFPSERLERDFSAIRRISLDGFVVVDILPILSDNDREVATHNVRFLGHGAVLVLPQLCLAFFSFLHCGIF